MPSIYAADFARLGDSARAIERARELGLAVGVAFNPETPVERAAAAAESAVAAIAHAGADLLVAAGAIFLGDDPAAGYRRLRARLEEHETRI